MINKKLDLIISMALLSSACLTGCSNPFKPSVSEGEVTVKTNTVAVEINLASELTTLKYKYTDVGKYEKDSKQINLFGESIDIPLTQDSIIFTYGGTICVGFDLKDGFEQKCDTKKKILKITIPEPKVLSHTPNPEVEHPYSVEKSKFLKPSQDEVIEGYQNAMAAFRQQKEEELMNDSEVIDDAKKQFKETCEILLKNNPDGKGYDIIWKE
ncbi:MAG: DUF4230 domain-containing protein [Ruminococcus sp.]|nr:DUF4230 domain-containing protein [Ruminococcus sp.]